MNMNTHNKAVCIAILICGMSTTSISFAQDCNQQIPQINPSSDFTDHGDGSITHQRTGLIWKKCLEGHAGVGCNSGSAMELNWGDALKYASAGWRLPNIKELSSIAERACFGPAINLSVFPGDPGLGVWSSSPNVNEPDEVWILHFDQGDNGEVDKDHTYHIRLVRDAQ